MYTQFYNKKENINKKSNIFYVTQQTVRRKMENIDTNISLHESKMRGCEN